MRKAGTPNPPPPGAGGEAGPRPKHPIGSVDSALALLLMFRHRSRIRISEASDALGVVRSTAHRLMAMLQYHGFVVQDPETKAYESGPALIEMGFTSLQRQNLEELPDDGRVRSNDSLVSARDASEDPEAGIAKRFERLVGNLDERALRTWAAAEAEALGRGGTAAVARVTGIAESTIRRGRQELNGAGLPERGRVRRAGAGRKPLTATDPTLLADLEGLAAEGKSQRQLAAELQAMGHRVSPRSVGTLLQRVRNQQDTR